MAKASNANNENSGREIEIVPPEKVQNSLFIQVNKNREMISNFFSNFFRQCKNPTRPRLGII
ncbi:hypothetical protein IQ37_05725 [Chryseobacterium piperi]|uniref:Uncharacterized protein n=1 Tax=Chryseobacterium piperi TaxID=558152 RepID=A0A086BKQ2_9FLAO|nr:hypothetical protein CJF12_00205 [Chryseobacterium piperi]KFF29516.1 hypothetical protein IQ37_05725 [Chryseobacterium piperi]